MFSSSGLFNNVPCPDKDRCKRARCLFSHSPNAKQPILPHIPVSVPTAGPSRLSNATNNSPRPERPHPNPPDTRTYAVPSKRPASFAKNSYAQSSGESSNEPPRKTLKLEAPARTTAPPSDHRTVGVPVLRINPAKSQVAIPVRQAMLKTLYECFTELYSEILESHPTLASEHALAQEQEVYDKSSKLTYRNAVISSVASLKKRSKPTSLLHESIGTEGTFQKRRESHDKLRSLRLSTEHLISHVMNLEQLKTWGFMTEIPDGPGGQNPSDEGKIKQCDRCNKSFVVKRKENADVCVHHWGRVSAKRINGEKLKVWSCCSQVVGDTEGCSRGPHVFYETLPEELHARHAFSFTRSAKDEPDTLDTALDVVCLDCEMIYTTGGARVARVSAVDGSGKEIFDELVKMDDEVEVIDYNTRFSGITEEEYEKNALLPLKSIRRALDAYINSNTIIVGHALENDLKTLRMVHLRCVDTAVLFPHRSGSPYRRALRDLTREVLGRSIQTGGGTSGHSSVEDSIATLDLVRWFVLNNPGTKKPKTVVQATSSSSSVPVTR
ncbi:REX3 [Sanghuangporus vaninii]